MTILRRPLNHMIMRVCMSGMTSVVICVMSLHNCSAVRSYFGFIDRTVTHNCSIYLSWSAHKSAIIWLIRIRPPFPVVGAAGALFGAVVDDASLFNNDTTVFRQRQASGNLFCIRRKRYFCLSLIFPRGQLVIHENDVPLHLRERRKDAAASGMALAAAQFVY